MKTLKFSHRAMIYLPLVALLSISTPQDTYAGFKSQPRISYAAEINRSSEVRTGKKARNQKITNCPPKGKFHARNSKRLSRSCYKFR